MTDTTQAWFASTMWRALNGPAAMIDSLQFTGSGTLPSVFSVSSLASASFGVAGLAAAQFLAAHTGKPPSVCVDRRLAAFWFRRSVEPAGWSLPATWDSVAGDYACRDGWIRLHTNAPHHRAAALEVLALADSSGHPVTREQVVQAVRGWDRTGLEQAVVGQGGCAAAMHSLAHWREHPQGRALAAEPLVAVSPESAGPVMPNAHRFDPARPLAGVRVLDLTRVLAGPVATRLLAALGAQVLRIDPPWWDEPAVLPDVTVGKRCARLEINSETARRQFGALLAQADVLVHGYRPGALEALGFSAERRRQIRPGLIDVSLNAYGWSGPWQGRRGFDSLVQMSSGIAEAGMRGFNKSAPFPLPVQALDHASGYLMAAAALRALTEQHATGRGSSARVSLGRVAHLLTSGPGQALSDSVGSPGDEDFESVLEQTIWGPLRRIRFPVRIHGTPFGWDRPAGRLGTSEPVWQ